MPILVDASGLRVLVVGGGAVAERKLLAFMTAGARVRVVAPSATTEICALAESGQVEWARRTYVPADVDEAQLVIVATDDRTANAMAAADALAMHRMVNVADAPEDGTFTMMATHRSGALVIGVSAGGVPGAAARIRDVIARRFDARYARALARLAGLRRTLLEGGEATRWRALAHGVVNEAFCQTVEEEALETKVASWQ